MDSGNRGLDRRQSQENPEFPLRLAGGELVKAERRSGLDRRHNGFISVQSFFNGVPYSTLEPLIALCEERHMEPGDTLLAPGQENHHLYLVLDGEFRVHIGKADSKECLLMLPGECMGEISIIDGKPASAFVIASRPSRILVIPEAVLWEQFFKIPLIARNFMSLFADRFRDRTRSVQQALEQQLRMEHLQRELAIAQDIQSSMLPDAGALSDHYPGLDLHASMTAASEVGGDFFDCFPLDEQRLCLALGDVSGKGIPAALFMVRTMTLLREQMLQNDDLPAAMARLNALLCQDNPRCMFATLVVGVLDMEKRRFEFVNAGHLRPLYGKGGGRFEFLPAPPGILVGINEQVVFQAATQSLAPGDLLVLYSDGVTEAVDSTEAMYGEQRLQNLLSSTENNDATGTVQTVEQSVQDFAAGFPQSDDLTLLVLRMQDR